MSRSIKRRALGLGAGIACLAFCTGIDCDDEGGGPGPVAPAVKDFVGTDTCKTCHARQYADHAKHGHNWKINKVENEKAPTYPFSTIPAGGIVPGAVGFDQISYVIGGYYWKARYMDALGYIFTGNGPLNAFEVQYNLPRADLNHPGSWSDYHATDSAPKPYTCGACHTTGWIADADAASDGDLTDNQDGLEGIHGTWDATGIQCERCHGNGSQHTQAGLSITESRATIDIDRSAALCGECHFRNASGKIEAKGGYIRHHEQYEELLSGAHKDQNCVDCHDPHESSVNEGGVGCYASACHTTVNATIETSHFGKTFSRTDGYTEDLSCESCHMSLATKSAVAASDVTVIGTTNVGRVGDTHTHLFGIDTSVNDYTSFIQTDPVDGKDYVVTDAAGKAAVTMDFACLRCHNDGTAIQDPAYTFSLAEAAKFAPAFHKGHFDGESEAFRHWDDDGTVSGSCATCHGGETGLDNYLQGTGATALTGNITFTAASKNVAGETGVSVFSTEVSAGDLIRLDSDGGWYEVDSVTDNENLVLVSDFQGTAGTGAASKLVSSAVPITYGFTCQTCHVDIAASTAVRAVDSVTFPGGVTVVDAGNKSNICMTCHSGRTGKKDIDDGVAAGNLRFMNVHYLAAAATLFGTDAKVGYEYTGKTYVGRWMHNGGGSPLNNCIDCHAPGNTGHTFQPKDNLASCQTCHAGVTDVHDIRTGTNTTDWDGDGDATEDLMDEVATLASALFTEIQAYATNTLASPIVYSSSRYPYWFKDTDADGVADSGEISYGNRYTAWDGKLMAAAHNYQHSQKEHGVWAHNFRYIVQLLIDSVEDLGGTVASYTRP
jgi:hypothetical protein